MAEQSVRCPKCNCAYCPVSNTRYKEITWHGKKVMHTRRYRDCQHCGWRFSTVETYEDESNIGFPLVKGPDPPISIKPPLRNPYRPPEPT